MRLIWYVIVLVNRSEWIEVPDDELDSMHFTVPGLSLKQGGFYSMKIGAINNAGMIATFETNGVLVDTTSPKVSYVAQIGSKPFLLYYWLVQRISI